MSKSWEEKYQTGELTLRGSVGKWRRWKWKQIRKFTGPVEFLSVIDVGCGDARFWKGRAWPRPYIGIDISETAIAQAKKVIPMGMFYNQDAGTPLNIEADLVLCLDLVFHLMDRDTVERVLTNLCNYSTEWIFIYNWRVDPSPFDESYQRFWDLDDFKTIFESAGFNLVHVGIPRFDKVGGMYVFWKMNAERWRS